MKRFETPIQRAVIRLASTFAKTDPNGVEHEQETVGEIRAAPPFPPVRVIALSGAKIPPRWMMSPDATAQRARNQKALAALSPRGEHMLSRASGHFPQMSEPEFVLAAIREVVARIRADTQR